MKRSSIILAFVAIALIPVAVAARSFAGWVDGGRASRIFSVALAGSAVVAIALCGGWCSGSLMTASLEDEKAGGQRVRLE